MGGGRIACNQRGKEKRHGWAPSRWSAAQRSGLLAVQIDHGRAPLLSSAGTPFPKGSSAGVVTKGGWGEGLLARPAPAARGGQSRSGRRSAGLPVWGAAPRAQKVLTRGTHSV